MPHAGAHLLDPALDGPSQTIHPAALQQAATQQAATQQAATQRAAAMALWILSWSLMLWPGGELGWIACLSPRERATELERQEQMVTFGLLFVGAAALTLWPHCAPHLRWAARAAWNLLCPQLHPEHAWDHLRLSLSGVRQFERPGQKADGGVR